MYNRIQNVRANAAQITTVNLGDSRAILLRRQQDTLEAEEEEDEDPAQCGRFRLV